MSFDLPQLAKCVREILEGFSTRQEPITCDKLFYKVDFSDVSIEDNEFEEMSEGNEVVMKGHENDTVRFIEVIFKR